MKRPLRIYSNANISDINYALGNILIAIENNPVGNDTYFLLVKDKLTSDYNLLTEVINQEKIKSDLSDEDKSRDDSTRALYYISRGLTYSQNIKERENATLIFNIMERNTLDVVNLPYSEQTVTLDSMLKDLDAPNIIDTINENFNFLTKYIDNLKKSVAEWKEAEQKAFENGRETAKPAYRLCIELRNVINDEFLVYIKAMAVANPAVYKKLEEQIRSIVDYTNKRISSRKSTTKKDM